MRSLLNHDLALEQPFVGRFLFVSDRHSQSFEKVAKASTYSILQAL